MPKATPLVERYHSKVDRRGPDDCWPWTAPLDPQGYGHIGIAGHRPDQAHRVGWQLAFGPIPSGLTVDHTCHNRDPNCPGGPCAHRACQNPAHWRLATRGENGLAGKNFAVINARKTHCVNGHEFTPENTRIKTYSDRPLALPPRMRPRTGTPST